MSYVHVYVSVCMWHVYMSYVYVPVYVYVHVYVYVYASYPHVYVNFKPFLPVSLYLAPSVCLSLSLVLSLPVTGAGCLPDKVHPIMIP